MTRAPSHVALAVSLLLAACAREVPMLEITLDAHEYAFTAPDTVAGGVVRVTFTNSGKERHHAQFMRLNDGVTLQQWNEMFNEALQAAATEGETAFMRIFQIATAAGGPGSIGGGHSLDLAMDLAGGSYVVVCFIAGPDGIPHIVKGMTRPLTVSAPAARQSAPPVAVASVDLVDFGFAGVPELKAGKTVLQVTNKGQEPHELLVMRLHGGIGVDQVMQMMAPPPPPQKGAKPHAPPAPPPGPPPFEFVGGYQVIMPGMRGWLTLDLTPGEYAVVCFVPSPPNQGKPHVTLGMVRQFTVQ